ncbi:MAG TPA: DUF481 domain-containing protein, partial [Polyangiaceae bacterium]|nr:DUF481 domain-containing protein [Polyangiaceae bacterium]
MRRRLGHRALPLALFASSTAVNAQVNVEPLRRQLTEDGVGARIAARLTGYEGNAQGVELGANVLVGGRHGRHFGYSSAAGDYTRLNRATQVSKTFAHARHNYEWTHNLWSELFAQVESDRFRRITLRELLGVGPRVALLERDTLALFYGTAYMLEYTRVGENAGVVDRTSIAQRWSNYAAFTFTPDPRVSFSETLYLQPRFDDFADFHLLSVAGLQFALTPRLSSRIDVTFRYESRHPPQVRPFDLDVKNALE